MLTQVENQAPISSTLVGLIYTYRDAEAKLLRVGDEREYVFVTNAAFKQLGDWQSPAKTRIEAKAALQLALDQSGAGESPVIPAMIRAAHGYLTSDAPDLWTDLCEIQGLVSTFDGLVAAAEQILVGTPELSPRQKAALSSLTEAQATIVKQADECVRRLFDGVRAAQTGQ